MPTTGWYRGIGLALGLVLLSGPSLAQTPSAETLKEWFQRHDRNGDGKLDRGEFQEGVVEGFYFRDKNRDGYLTIEELGGASPEAVKAASRAKAERLTVDEFVNALFKDFAAADKDGDGTLTLEEIDVYIHTNQR
jgi:Ca2+-binding EF-hand superfamily protein